MTRARPLWTAAIAASFAPTLAVALIAGCGETSRTDPRFATPERTVETLLAAHGVEGASSDELIGRIAGGGLTVVDRDLHARCFADLDRPGGQAMANHVLGMIAAARDDLRYETVGEHGYVIPREGARIVMDRGADGAYRIVLARSVPEDVRRTVLELEAIPPRPRREEP